MSSKSYTLGWTLYFTDNCCIVDSSRNASSAIFALNSLLNVCRVLPISFFLLLLLCFFHLKLLSFSVLFYGRSIFVAAATLKVHCVPSITILLNNVASFLNPRSDTRPSVPSDSTAPYRSGQKAFWNAHCRVCAPQSHSYFHRFHSFAFLMVDFLNPAVSSFSSQSEESISPSFSVVGNAISFIQKQRPLLFPFLTHSRHINPPFRLIIKNHRKDTSSLFMWLFGAKIGGNPRSKPFKKSHKIFVLTCGYVWNCEFWSKKTPYFYDVFCSDIFFCVLINWNFGLFRYV